jgi:hypothetical protein
MLKISSVLALIALLAACAHAGDMPTVRAGNDADSSKVRTDGQGSRGAMGAAENNSVSGYVR